MSPSLFAIAEDVLSVNLTWLVQNKKLKPMISCPRYQSPSHLLFTDDILLFANGGIKGIRNIMELLLRYQRALGQVMNKTKTKIFLVEWHTLGS